MLYLIFWTVILSLSVRGTVATYRDFGREILPRWQLWQKRILHTQEALKSLERTLVTILGRIGSYAEDCDVVDAWVKGNDVDAKNFEPMLAAIRFWRKARRLAKQKRALLRRTRIQWLLFRSRKSLEKVGFKVAQDGNGVLSLNGGSRRLEEADQPMPPIAKVPRTSVVAQADFDQEEPEGDWLGIGSGTEETGNPGSRDDDIDPELEDLEIRLARLSVQLPPRPAAGYVPPELRQDSDGGNRRERPDRGRGGDRETFRDRSEERSSRPSGPPREKRTEDEAIPRPSGLGAFNLGKTLGPPPVSSGETDDFEEAGEIGGEHGGSAGGTGDTDDRQGPGVTPALVAAIGGLLFTPDPDAEPSAATSMGGPEEENDPANALDLSAQGGEPDEVDIDDDDDDDDDIYDIDEDDGDD